ncbi:hypothetical protein SEA_WEASELS2_19 [Rhodococcus phage Weasels2]|uniref:Uncharacterized protein n=1 Tax=Rhodococcus phage Weasels2 TaxID=1897437 RepID=A0A1I9SA03_9CAUD|nr:hypothetical protein FDH04_gp019 [Rhodococcus phage Weasels2]AOZ63609.1 hypothetical protein SEA_WEASELS2_19 [Rhodococcus phage Weasels2]
MIELIIFVVFFLLGAAVAVYKFAPLKFLKKRRAEPRISKEQLAVLKYENFGHNFSIADLIAETLIVRMRPPLTTIEWETYDEKFGKETEKRLRVKIVSQTDTECFTEFNISLERPGNSRYGTYAEAYQKNGFMFYDKDKESTNTPRECIVQNLVKPYDKATVEFANKYKSQIYGSDLNGAL